MIKMIWAMDEDFAIGKDNLIPWHIKEDLLYFKECVKGYPVVMGYNNYISMLGYYKNRKLPYKKTYVLTSKNLEDDGISVIHNIDEILKLEEDVFIVGGAYTYKEFYPYADELYISYIKGHHNGDTFIDFLNFDEFELKSDKESELVRYTIYSRKK